MAVPVGSSSSYWASIDRSSPFHKNPKFTAWQYVGKGFKIHLSNVVKGRTIYGVPKSNSGFPTRRQTPFAASDDNLPHGEPDSYASEPQSTILMERTNGKPGFISFHGLPYQKQAEILGLSTSKGTPKFLLFVGPTVLVAFLVFPSLYLRRILSSVFEDSLLTDFLILFFTEALFYGGLAIFLLLVDRVWRPVQRTTLESCDWSRTWFEPRVFSVATLVLSLIIPLVTMGMVWPWTGPAASATLAPYLVGLVVQFAFEQYSRHHKSPAWPVIPVVFQVYRLHQLNRAAQLVTALSFSVRGAESTPQTSAINGSLGTLLTVLQILGVICVWSLSNFVMRFLPSSEVIPEP